MIGDLSERDREHRHVHAQGFQCSEASQAGWNGAYEIQATKRTAKLNQGVQAVSITYKSQERVAMKHMRTGK